VLAKLTSKNPLTRPKAAVESVGAPEYFEVEVRDGQLVLSPVRLRVAPRPALQPLGPNRPTRGSSTPACANPFARSRHASHAPQGAPSGPGS